VRQGNATVYEANLLSEIDQRQRLVIEHGATVERVGLVVSLSNVASADDIASLYARIVRTMIERYGRPHISFELGSFGRNYARDIADGKLIRIVEWDTRQGTLRLGIPRRLDGNVRIEVLHAIAFSTPRDTNWGLLP
jgi:hypothetical protein